MASLHHLPYTLIVLPPVMGPAAYIMAIDSDIEIEGFHTGLDFAEVKVCRFLLPQLAKLCLPRP